ncbi:hypothetical protein PHAVU_003G297233 [Phaseolus vulgaris]
MAVKFAKAFGAKVTVISTSPNKKKEAIEHLGADSFLINRNQDVMEAAKGTLDGIIDTFFAVHPLLPLLELLKAHGKLVIVGLPYKPLELSAFPLIGAKRTCQQLTGSSINGGPSGETVTVASTEWFFGNSFPSVSPSTSNGGANVNHTSNDPNNNWTGVLA